MHFGNDVNNFNNSNNNTILFMKGSKYINWKQLEILADAVEGYATQWLKREKRNSCYPFGNDKGINVVNPIISISLPFIGYLNYK